LARLSKQRLSNLIAKQGRAKRATVEDLLGSIRKNGRRAMKFDGTRTLIDEQIPAHDSVIGN
jgi:hypothetical protein